MTVTDTFDKRWSVPQIQCPGNGATYIIHTDKIGRRSFIRICHGLMDCCGVTRWIIKSAFK